MGWRLILFRKARVIRVGLNVGCARCTIAPIDHPFGCRPTGGIQTDRVCQALLNRLRGTDVGNKGKHRTRFEHFTNGSRNHFRSPSGRRWLRLASAEIPKRRQNGSESTHKATPSRIVPDGHRCVHAQPNHPRISNETSTLSNTQNQVFMTS